MRRLVPGNVGERMLTDRIARATIFDSKPTHRRFDCAGRLCALLKSRVLSPRRRRPAQRCLPRLGTLVAAATRL